MKVNLFWTMVGAWICGLAVLLHWAMPKGYYLDGKLYPWAPMQIPMLLGFSFLSLGLAPFVRYKIRHADGGNAKNNCEECVASDSGDWKVPMNRS
jgi:hypothetical protein